MILEVIGDGISYKNLELRSNMKRVDSLLERGFIRWQKHMSCPSMLIVRNVSLTLMQEVRRRIMGV
jgi:hypothetical protein